MTRLEECLRDRDQVTNCLGMLARGMRTYDAIDRQCLDDHDTTDATKAGLERRLESLDKRIQRLQAEH